MFSYYGTIYRLPIFILFFYSSAVFSSGQSTNLDQGYSEQLKLLVNELKKNNELEKAIKILKDKQTFFGDTQKATVPHVTPVPVLPLPSPKTLIDLCNEYPHLLKTCNKKPKTSGGK